jgi:hypothetical protein
MGYPEARFKPKGWPSTPTWKGEARMRMKVMRLILAVLLLGAARADLQARMGTAKWSEDVAVDSVGHRI